MKIETLLDKMVWAEDNKDYVAYRAQILRMFAEKDEEIEALKESCRIYSHYLEKGTITLESGEGMCAVD